MKVNFKMIVLLIFFYACSNNIEIKKDIQNFGKIKYRMDFSLCNYSFGFQDQNIMVLLSGYSSAYNSIATLSSVGYYHINEPF